MAVRARRLGGITPRGPQPHCCFASSGIKKACKVRGGCVVCVVSEMLKTEEEERRVGCRKTYVRTFCLRCIRVGCMFSTIILTEGLAIFDEERVFLPTTSCE